MEPERNADAGLRAITIVAFVPAFAFLVPHGVESGMLCPVLGTVPMGLSALLGLLLASRWRPAALAAGLPLLVCADAFLAAFLIAILVPAWLQMASATCWRYCHYEPGIAMLGSYGSMMMMISFCIHSYLVLRELSLRHVFMQRSAVCLHCKGDLYAPRRPFVPSDSASVASLLSHDSKGSYYSVNAEESAPEYSQVDHCQQQQQQQQDHALASCSRSPVPSRTGFGIDTVDEVARLVRGETEV